MGVVLVVLFCGLITVGPIGAAVLAVVFVAVMVATSPARHHERAHRRAVEERQRPSGCSTPCAPLPSRPAQARSLSSAPTTWGATPWRPWRAGRASREYASC